MHDVNRTRLALIALLAVASGCSRPPSPPQPQTQAVPPSPVAKATAMTMPVRLVTSHQLPTDSREHVYATQPFGVTPPDALELGFIPRQGEEPAQGPNAFDVSGDGTIVIADPVNHRIAAYAAADGTPAGAPASRVSARPLVLGFSADLVRVSGRAGSIEVREASTGIVREIPSAPLLKSGGPPPAPEPKLSARLIDDRRAVVSVETAGQPPDRRDVTVTFAGGDGERLVSVTPLGVTADRVLVAVLEIGRPAVKEVSVRRVIQAYDASGTLVAEATDVPPQADIAPETEFKLASGVVYQLVSGSAGAMINAWNLRR